MPTNSKSQILTAVALALGLAAVLGPASLTLHGLAHDLLRIFTNLLTLFLATALVLFATETDSYRATPKANSDNPEAQGSMRPTPSIQDKVLNLLRWVALGLNTGLSRKNVLRFKQIFFLITALFALASLAEVYQHGNFATWSDCLLLFSISLCFGLSIILQLVIEPDCLPNRNTSLPSDQSPTPLSRQEASQKFTALIQLLACQAFLWLSIVWFEKALKDGHFGQWWSFACFTGAGLCFTSVFVRGSLRAARQKRQLKTAVSAG